LALMVSREDATKTFERYRKQSELGTVSKYFMESVASVAFEFERTRRGKHFCKKHEISGQEIKTAIIDGLIYAYFDDVKTARQAMRVLREWVAN